MPLCVHEGLVAEFAAKERVQLLDESITGTLCALDRSFVGRSHLAGTVFEVAMRQTQYHLFESSHYTSEVDTFTGETTVCIYAEKSTQLDTFMPVRPY